MQLNHVGISLIAFFGLAGPGAVAIVPDPRSALPAKVA